MALQEAFVRLLPERGYEALTIREIVDVAGTGLGSFYEYFANKEDLARVSIHLRTKVLLQTIRDTVALQRGQPLREMLDAIIHALTDIHREHPAQWAVHYLIERRISDAAAYSKMYDRFVKAWADAITAAADASTDKAHILEVARTCHTIIYGLFAHAHIQAFATGGSAPDLQRLLQQSLQGLLGYLDCADVYRTARQNAH